MQVKLTRKNGVLKVDINGKLYDPLSFKSFRANPQNVSEFYRAGVRLFSVLSSGITSALGVYNASESDAVICVKEDGMYEDLIEGGTYESRNGKLCLPKKEINAFLFVKA